MKKKIKFIEKTKWKNGMEQKWDKVFYSWKFRFNDDPLWCEMSVEADYMLEMVVNQTIFSMTHTTLIWLFEFGQPK